MVRNIQLGSFGVPLSATYMLVKDGQQIWKAGLLQGFDIWAWLVVAMQVGRRDDLGGGWDKVLLRLGAWV